MELQLPTGTFSRAHVPHIVLLFKSIFSYSRVSLIEFNRLYSEANLYMNAVLIAKILFIYTYIKLLIFTFHMQAL